MAHEKFHYAALGEVAEKAAALHAFVPLQENLSVLYQPLDLGGRRVENRIAFQPMEGTDGTEGGAPGELTCRRYRRFAEAGPGLIWFEAVATVPEGRASAHQLYLTEQNVDDFRRLTDDIRETSLRKNGYAPVLIMQATHSGRYSKPHGTPEPLIAYSCPPLEDAPLPKERILSDDDLRRFEEAYTRTARLCHQAGFDGMDVKCCLRAAQRLHPPRGVRRQLREPHPLPQKLLPRREGRSDGRGLLPHLPAQCLRRLCLSLRLRRAGGGGP